MEPRRPTESTPDEARLNALFDHAAELPLSERTAFLNEACGADQALRRQIEELLAADALAGSFLSDLTFDPSSAAAVVARSDAVGGQIGRYRLVEHIGDGGFGTVFRAEQTHPVKRQVALKVIKLGMDTKAVIARFEAERQALAMMDHPHIAKVLDAGATEAGRPYFVMELVQGQPITHYCDEHRLTLTDRLRLMIEVCRAVQHAHQKGIIHRDLKPSNILVSTVDGQPSPRVIDFGIAKAAGDLRLTDHTVVTMGLGPIGTPAYMSPEQASAEGWKDVDTRADVYSLGVILYELLTGSPPFDPKSLANASYLTIQRMICEVEPPRPSTRVKGATVESAMDLASKRNAADAVRLRQMLTGELDWITLRAMEKDRERRYPSVSDLADDIERHLSDKPVAAGPPTRRYRVAKFVRRHRGVVAAAVAIALILCVAAGAVVWQTIQAQRAEARATRRFNDVRGIANKMLFDFDNAILHVPGTIKARRILVTTSLEYLDRLAKDVGDDPALENELAMAYIGVGKIQFEPSHPNLNDRVGATTSFKKAVDIARVVCAEHPNEPRYQLTLALALARYGVTGYPYEPGPAVAACREAVATLKPLLPEFSGNLVVAVDYGALVFGYGWALHDTGEFAEAMRVRRETLEYFERLRTKFVGDVDVLRWLASSHLMLGESLHSAGKLDEARREMQAGRDLHEELARGQPASSFALRSIAMADAMIGTVAAEQKDFATAVACYERSVDVMEQQAAVDPENMQARAEFGMNLHRLIELKFESGDRAGAVETMEKRFLPIVRKRYSAGHNALVAYELEYASILRAVGRFADAEAVLLANEQAAAAANSAKLPDVYREQAALYRAWGKPDLAGAAEAKLIKPATQPRSPHS